MNVIFTAWDYQVTLVEFSAFLVAIVAVVLAAIGTRWAWPFYFVSGALYAWLFVSLDLLGSAALQVVFLAAAIWGWIAWGRDGITESRRLTWAKRAVVVGVSLAVWLVVTPLLTNLGAVATLLDAFVLVGSIAAQVLMVKGFVEAWPAWVVVNLVGVYHYANQQLYFTSLLYAVLLVLAGWGWWQWNRLDGKTAQSETEVAALTVGA